MALVDLTSVTTGNIGTNTNFIVEENKVLKRISQSSLLKTSAISTTQVNSTTNVPSSSLVYSMNQSINKLNSDIQYGRVAGTALPVQDVTRKHVDFEHTFSKEPKVSITIYSNSTYIEYKDLTITVNNITKTGFDINLYNGSNKELIPAVDWIAIGT